MLVLTTLLSTAAGAAQTRALFLTDSALFFREGSNMIRKLSAWKKGISMGLIMSVASFSTLFTSSVMAQSSPMGLRAAGELAIVGNVLLNGTPAIAGATVFSDSVIKTGEGGATVNLGTGGRIELAANSEMVVRFTETNVGGNLKAGSTTVSAPAGIAVSVATAEGTAINNGDVASTLLVDVTCGNTRVAAMKSDAKLVAVNKTELVAEGQQASVGQEGAPKCARLLAATKYEGLSPAALAALIIAGIGGAVAGIIAAASADDITPSGIVVSGFRPGF
jgi:hypothetical protein